MRTGLPPVKRVFRPYQGGVAGPAVITAAR